MKESIFYFFAILLALNGISQAQNIPVDSLSNDIVSWNKLPDLPNKAGLAGAFVGAPNNQTLIIAGGANFPQKAPWEGGHKKYYNQIHVLSKDSTGYQWLNDLNLSLPEPLAYGATVPAENGLILIGGTNGQTVSSSIIRLRWHQKTGSIELDTLPPLPRPLAFMSASRLGDNIFVAGGQHSVKAPEASNTFWRLDLSKKNTQDDFKWEQLHAWPGPSRVMPVSAIQYKGEVPYFYLFSGRNLHKDGSIDILNDVYRYNIEKKEWDKLSNVGPSEKGRSVMGASAFSIGDAHIILLGGDPGQALSERLEISAKVDSLESLSQSRSSKQSLLIQQQIDSLNTVLLQNLTQEHPFSEDILSYHTITDTWNKIGELPSPAPVTTRAVRQGDSFVIPSGEVQPGLRSPNVWQGTIRPETPGFGLVNYSALLIYGLILLGIGFYFSSREDATEDYFLANNRIPWWAAGISIYATQLSAITFIATPVLSFANNWIVFVSYFTILLIAPVVIHFYLPFFRRLNVTSAYEYLEKRFHLAVRLFGSLSFSIFQLGRMSIVVFLPALTLTAILDMNIYTAILLMGILATVYTTMGGIEAVIWTDVIQVLILVAGMLYSIYFIITYVGGLDVVYTTALEYDKLRFLNFDFSFTSLATWSIFFGSFALQFGPYTTDQAVVQRYLTTKDEKSAAASIWTNGIISIPTGFLFFALGTCLFVFYKLHPNFLTTGMQNDQIFPLFIGQQVPVGFAGLIIAGIFSASMSSLDSSMHSMATVITVDFYERFVPESSDQRRLNLARWATIIVGALGTLIACLLASLSIQSLYFFFQELIGLLSSSLAGIFILGIFTQRTHGTGALIGAIASIIVLYGVKFHTPIHFYIYPLIGTPVCIMVGYFFSLLLPDHGKNLEGLTYRTLVAAEETD